MKRVHLLPENVCLKIMMPNLLQTFQFFLLHSSVFALEKYPKHLNFQMFLPPEEHLEAKCIHSLPENIYLN